MTAHLSWETLNDYADDILTPDARADAANHLDACAECRESLARLREMLSAATAAATPVAPPVEAWKAVRATIESGKVVAMPGSRRPDVRPSRYMLAVAAVALIFVSSATTALIMSVRNQPVSAGVAIADTTVALPVSVVSEERGYVRTVEELTAALNDSRAKLSPETVRAVQRSLKIIDAAIAEARDALARDPASPVLRTILAKSYQQKVDVLRRASTRVLETEESK